MLLKSLDSEYVLIKIGGNKVYIRLLERTFALNLCLMCCLLTILDHLRDNGPFRCGHTPFPIDTFSLQIICQFFLSKKLRNFISHSPQLCKF